MLEDTNLQNTEIQSIKESIKPDKRQYLKDIVTKSRLKITDDIPEMPVCLEIEQNGKVCTIGTLGNILMIQAKAKAGKTYLTSAIVASLLTSKQIINFRGYLPDDKKRIIYFDTEQGNEDARTVQERIYKMAGLSMNTEAKYFDYYCLRRYSASDRCQAIEMIIYETKQIGVVVIDGIRDLINDFNDTAQSFIMINKLMSWTDELRINIIAILHQNPNDDKARGHLGTEITNKAEFILSLKKEQEEDSYRRIEGYGRRKSFNPFNYSLDENDFPILTNIQRELKKIDPFKLDLQTHRNLLDIIYRDKPADYEFSLNTLFPQIKNHFNKMSKYIFTDAQCRDLVHHYIDQKLIRNNGSSDKMKLSRI